MISEPPAPADVSAVRQRDASWSERLRGLVPDSLARRRVMLVGCGSVGSFMADELCRVGVTDFLVVDPDVVSAPNLSRSVYRHADIGSPKVEALRRHLLSIYPDVRVQTDSREVQALGPELSDVLATVDLVVSAVDDPRASGTLDRFCYAVGVPCLFVGLYKGARGGEAIAVHPRFTPCLACATGGVREAIAGVADSSSVERSRDYGTNRLVAEVALGCDIHFVSAAAVKMALSLLSLDSEELSISTLMRSPLQRRAHYVIFGMEPDYFLFPATHSEAIGQHAFQSLWLQTASRPECIRCGDAEHREPPF